MNKGAGDDGDGNNDGNSDADNDADTVESEDDPAQENDRMNNLRKAAGLPELPLDGLPSASAQKMTRLISIGA